MLSIGTIAHRTGVSRRMLRHWDREGLLTPAFIDPTTGYRHYRDSQLGRVRAIKELRALDLGLVEIRRLLDPAIGRSDLESILSHQADVLRAEITEASTRLEHLQRRLETIRRTSQEITMRMTLAPLPGLDLWGLSTAVVDETEIGHAVSELHRRLPETTDAIVLLYDGTRDDRITVSAATASQPDAEEVRRITAPAAEHGVTVTFDVAPESIADAWVLIDTELEKQNLTSSGVHRQIDDATGGVTLQAPVRPRS